MLTMGGVVRPGEGAARMACGCHNVRRFSAVARVIRDPKFLKQNVYALRLRWHLRCICGCGTQDVADGD